MTRPRAPFKLFSLLLLTGVLCVGCESCITPGVQPQTAADVAEAGSEAPDHDVASNGSEAR